MTRLICGACGYKMVMKGKVPQRCPYCSRENVLELEKSAQDIIEEVSSNPKRFE
jgi:hypothetical protein